MSTYIKDGVTHPGFSTYIEPYVSLSGVGTIDSLPSWSERTKSLSYSFVVKKGDVITVSWENDYANQHDANNYYTTIPNREYLNYFIEDWTIVRLFSITVKVYPYE